MATVPQLATLLHPLFTGTANQLGRETGFIQRQGKVTGALFVQTLLWGWLSANDATLALIANTGHRCGLTITAMIKHVAAKRVVDSERRIVRDGIMAVHGLLAMTAGVAVINTAFIERFNGTLRQS